MEGAERKKKKKKGKVLVTLTNLSSGIAAG